MDEESPLARAAREYFGPSPPPYTRRWIFPERMSEEGLALPERYGRSPAMATLDAVRVWNAQTPEERGLMPPLIVVPGDEEVDVRLAWLDLSDPAVRAQFIKRSIPPKPDLLAITRDVARGG